MTHDELDELDDNDLLQLTRRGHRDAYAVLFDRYVYSAHRLARHLGRRDDYEDVVSESFAQVLAQLRAGKGPDTTFRPYLFTTIRHEAARRARLERRVLPTDDQQQIDRSVPFGGGALDEFERSSIRDAYRSLPPRWRTVLWHLEVEGLKPVEVGPLLELSPNSVSALVYRARAGLREAYLQQHLRPATPDDGPRCRDLRNKLPAFVRESASRRDGDRVSAHLDVCPSCRAICLDLHEINRGVGGITVHRPGAAAAPMVATA